MKGILKFKEIRFLYKKKDLQMNITKKLISSREVVSGASSTPLSYRLFDLGVLL